MGQIMGNDMDKLVYLSTGDRQLESYLDNKAFERNLLLSILFQPGVLVPDIFFFISSSLASHLKQSRLSLLEAGLQHGIVVPSFRDPSIGDFHTALEVVRGKGDLTKAIYGIRSDADDIARRLDLATNKAGNFSPKYWQSGDVGSKFQKIVEKLLKQEQAPHLPPECGISQEQLDNLWDYTEKWRVDCVDRAIENTKKIAGEGLRRGILMTEVGRELGLVKGRAVVNDISELFDSRVSPEDQNALHYFCRWMTDCYQFNQATELGAMPNFPEYEPLSGVIASTLLSNLQNTTEQIRRKYFSIEVPMPPIDYLLQMDPEYLVKIQNEKGPAYRAALDNWLQKQDTGAEQTLETELRKYADEIVKWVRRKENIQPGLLEAIIGNRQSIDPYWEWALGTTVSAAVAQVSPEKALLLAIGNTGYALYRWYKRRPKQLVIQFGYDTTSAVKASRPDLIINPSTTGE